MKHIFLDRTAGRLALYLNGDLQFDSRDERDYHEPLAGVPVFLAQKRYPNQPLRVLILGGGDGLAAREVLRYQRVQEVHVVDRDPDIVGLAKTDWVELNGGSFLDPRCHVHLADVHHFLPGQRGFHVVIVDLTYPRDAEGAALFSLRMFRKLKRILKPRGILSLNSVSPEKTPKAFRSIGLTLESAGLQALPYTFELPSFLQENYGRWGFFYASSRKISSGEFDGFGEQFETVGKPDSLKMNTLVPASFNLMPGVGINNRDELLYYLNNTDSLFWIPPLEKAVFPAPQLSLKPRLTVNQSFSEWIHTGQGHRTLDRLLRCIPLSQRDQTRELLLEWKYQADLIFKEVDIKKWIDSLLSETRELPKNFARELKRLRQKLEENFPSMEDLLFLCYRALAILMIVLLLANLFFPDHLYAKGFSSHYGGGSDGGYSFSSGPSQPHFYYGTHGYSGSIYDRNGREYPRKYFRFTNSAGQNQMTENLMALTADYHLLKSGSIAYLGGAPGYNAIIDPQHMTVFNEKGEKILDLQVSDVMRNDIRSQIESQKGLLNKAVADHQQWLSWVSWEFFTEDGRQSKLATQQLDEFKQTLFSAADQWAAESHAGPVQPKPGWVQLFPGLYLEPRKDTDFSSTAVALTKSDGETVKSFGEIQKLKSEEDRFIAASLLRFAQTSNDARVKSLAAQIVPSAPSQPPNKAW